MKCYDCEEEDDVHLSTVKYAWGRNCADYNVETEEIPICEHCEGYFSHCENCGAACRNEVIVGATTLGQLCYDCMKKVECSNESCEDYDPRNPNKCKRPYWERIQCYQDNKNIKIKERDDE